MFWRRLFRVLDLAYLFFALVILSSLLWAGAGWVVVWALLPFSLSWTRWGLAPALYLATVSGFIGFFWGLKRWRKHLEEEAAKAQRDANSPRR